MQNDTQKESPKKVNAYRKAQNDLRPTLITVLAFSAVVNVLMLTGSIYMLQIYDRVLSSGSIPTLVGLFGVVVILYSFLAFFDALRARMLSRAALKLDATLGKSAFRKWLSSGLPDEGYAAEAQPLRDLDTLRNFVSGPAVTTLLDLPFVPLFLAVLFLIHPWLGLLTVGGALVGAVIAFLNQRVTGPAIQKSGLHDMIEREFADRGRRGAEATIAMGMSHAITERWEGMHTTTLASNQSGSDPSEIMASASKAFRMLLQSAMLTLGALLVLRGDISAGMIIASSILSGRALAPVDQLIGQWRAIGRAGAAHRRIDAVFANDTPEPERIHLADPTGQISVNRLTKLGAEKSGGADRAKILSDVSFSLQPGEGLGVIGNSASGKSTLARLLVGAALADAGEIRLDGATPDQWDPQRLGRSIGYLPQMLEMLPGSIRDNIARFDPDTQDDDVIAAAKLTGVHEMILGLSDGYATQLCVPGEAQPLSGGQLQRLGLARAVFGMPALVVLDEPNSNLDVAGDKALTHTIDTLRKAGSVVIVMAHRPSALAAVDKLMILDGGVTKLFGDKETVLKGGPAAPAKVVEKAPMAPTPAPVAAAQPEPNKAPNPQRRAAPGMPQRKPTATLSDAGVITPTKPAARPHAAQVPAKQALPAAQQKAAAPADLQGKTRPAQPPMPKGPRGLIQDRKPMAGNATPPQTKPQPQPKPQSAKADALLRPKAPQPSMADLTTPKAAPPKPADPTKRHSA